MRPSRAIATTAACLATGSLSIAAPAFAGGKAEAGCADGSWTLAQYVTVTVTPTGPVAGDLIDPDGSVQQRNHDGLTWFADHGIDVVSIFKTVDNNGDGSICWKLPAGWQTTPPSNIHGQYFLSLTDNKL